MFRYANPNQRRFVANGLLLISCSAFLVGITLPLMTIRQFFLFSDSFSLLSALCLLVVEGNYLLFLILGLFSVLFPLIKMLTIFIKINQIKVDGWIPRGLMVWCLYAGKWSMLDVFVIALLVVAIKLQVLVNVAVHYGLSVFTISVILTNLLSQLTERWFSVAEPG